MLGKLLKHEWKSIWKIPTILVLVLQVIALGAGLTFIYPFWKSEMVGLDILIMLVWLLFYFAIIAVSIGITLYLAVHFYKSMYTDEGYLTHTLPVTSHQLLISKILPMTGWVYIGMLAVFLALFLFGSAAVTFLYSGDMGLLEMIKYMVETVLEGLEQMGVFTSDLIGFLLSIVLMLLVSGFSGTMMMVGSISLGQLIGKHKILGSIGAYLVINFISQTISTIAMIPMMIGSMGEEMINVFEVLTPTYLIMTVISALFAVGLYFLSNYIVSRKLNLD